MHFIQSFDVVNPKPSLHFSHLPVDLSQCPEHPSWHVSHREAPSNEYVPSAHVEQTVDFSGLQNLQQFAGVLEEYFNQCVSVYNEIASVEQPEKVKGLIVGTRINEVAKNLKVIKGYNNNFVSLTNEEINNCVLQISKNMTQFV